MVCQRPLSEMITVPLDDALTASFSPAPHMDRNQNAIGPRCCPPDRSRSTANRNAP